MAPASKIANVGNQIGNPCSASFMRFTRILAKSIPKVRLTGVYTNTCLVTLFRPKTRYLATRRHDKSASEGLPSLEQGCAMMRSALQGNVERNMLSVGKKSHPK